MNLTHNGQAQMQLYSTCCLLERTISMADPTRSYWDTSKGLIFRTATGDCGWECKDHKLYYATGTYDFIQHAWITKTKSIVAMHISAFKSHPVIQHDQVQKVTVCIECASSIPRYETTIFLINRTV